ncbi:hypothetical protein H4R33_000372 [Dimargaris cristalligena]|uniref:Uncharacterized protein n=1 Tax=Dimargaris cristalligena TaxID=215637 RepID=A0A4V1J5V6_9FUNG|nr:hypothetical protein H4R33_000372 [Dimargaris cristalligena]RKP40389.1 hypothetical protein BJ085DRAFT_40445 [Dimargaris cristalligena]|eukprot:RKP40389.1 hypothetical protein BJ085DRAFT_40445 [Dimargaris cristalligena]
MIPPTTHRFMGILDIRSTIKFVALIFAIGNFLSTLRYSLQCNVPHLVLCAVATGLCICGYFGARRSSTLLVTLFIVYLVLEIIATLSSIAIILSQVFHHQGARSVCHMVLHTYRWLIAGSACGKRFNVVITLFILGQVVIVGFLIYILVLAVALRRQRTPAYTCGLDAQPVALEYTTRPDYPMTMPTHPPAAVVVNSHGEKRPYLDGPPPYSV